VSRRALDGKVALVTGAARDRSIGRGIALVLAEHGCDVAVNDVAHEDEALRRVAEIEAAGGRGAFVRADVSQPEENERLVAEVVERLGRLDVFVANAGVASWQNLPEVTREAWNAVVGVNLHGVLFGCQAAAAQMQRQRTGGRIVVTSSVHAVSTGPPLGVYGATKHAVAYLVGVLAREWGSEGIAVNHVGPGWVDTNINDVSPDFRDEASRQRVAARIPFGRRPAEPREIGEAVAYFAAATYTTGAYLRVDGGLVIGKY
jgi:meso-butanediol dehydrogenase/(S,S)-butanediol dehydrogenase/diacetyl reductase